MKHNVLNSDFSEREFYLVSKYATLWKNVVFKRKCLEGKFYRL